MQSVDPSQFAWLINHQPAVLFSYKKSTTSNQSAVLFSQNKPAPVISHQPNEQGEAASNPDFLMSTKKQTDDVAAYC
jgi:hypothetical protein